MNIQKINLDLLTAKDSNGKWAQFDETGVRERCMDATTVSDYADAMTDGCAFPPVVLFYDGQRHWIADGFHRIAAAEQCGFIDIDADVRDGTRLDAVWFALGANRQHGRRMTHDDRIAAVKRGVIEFHARSNREIARQIGCDDKTVGAVRASLESTAIFPQLDRTVGADGKSRPAKRESNAPAVDVPAVRTGVSFAESYRDPDVPVEDTPAVHSQPVRTVKPAARVLNPPSNGMQFARMALLDLEQITEDDAERKGALAEVKQWLAVNAPAAVVHSERQPTDPGKAMREAWKTASKADRENFMAWAHGRGSDLPAGSYRFVMTAAQKLRRLLLGHPALIGDVRAVLQDVLEGNPQ